MINLGEELVAAYLKNIKGCEFIWKHNARNVLQYRKKTGEIEWNGAANYRM